MCATCGCSTETHEHPHPHGPEHAHGHDHVHPHAPEPALIRLERDLLAKNAGIAERTRGWFAGRGVLALNFVSSPGAGKTTLLERMIRDLGREFPIQVIEGDQATERDA